MINDLPNIFQIERALNQAKRTIPINSYSNDPTIRRYMGFQVQGGTVLASVRAHAEAMRGRVSAYDTLTRMIGMRFTAVMGW